MLVVSSALGHAQLTLFAWRQRKTLKMSVTLPVSGTELSTKSTICAVSSAACALRHAPRCALTMTNDFELANASREALIYGKDKLLAPLEDGMEMPPHPRRLADNEKGYFMGLPLHADSRESQQLEEG